VKQRSTTEDRVCFLNVDLEVVGTVDLNPLVEHLAGAAFVLRDTSDDGRRTLWFELEQPGDPERTVDATLRCFIALLSTLSPPLTALWEACDDRCLNIGIQRGLAPHSSGYRVDAETLARLAAISTRLEITIYGAAQGNE
jgi:hypothetical protein